MTLSIEQLHVLLRKFADDRDWNQFHSPKNLVMALSGEVGELNEVFQWLSEEQSKNLSHEQMLQVKQEIADILLYTIRLSDQLNIDLLQAAAEKLEINGNKYPVAKSKGNATKYDKL